ncbi:MAG TPA: hypothetical protein PKY81_08745 [bacterium]|nr:hypothetical protein [bacterium]HPN31032.1 hypothetical protein [bacterium]
MRKSFFVFILCVLCLSEKSFAAGTTGADFLRIDNSIISSALGGASVSRKLGIESVFSNPANFYDVSGGELYFMHFQGFGKNKYTNLMYAGNLAGSIKIGAGIIYSYINDIYSDYTGLSENNTEFTNSDMAVQLSLSKKITGKIAAGLSFKYFKQSLGDGIPISGYPYSAGAYCVDAGWLFDIAGINIGAVYKNILIGSKPKFKVEKFDLPEYFKIGISKQILNSVVVSADYQNEKNEKSKYCAGIDFKFKDNLRFLTGYKYNPGNESADGFAFGFKVENFLWSAGYSYSPFENADAEHRIGASYKWGAYQRGSETGSAAKSIISLSALPRFYITNNFAVSYQYNDIDNKNISYHIPQGNSNLTLFTMANGDKTDVFFKLKANSDKWDGAYIDNFLLEIRNKESDNNIQIGDISGFTITDYSFSSKSFRGVKLEKKIVCEKPLKNQEKIIALVDSLNNRKQANPGGIITDEIILKEKKTYEFDFQFFAGYTEQGMNIGDKYKKQNRRYAFNNVYEQQVYGINVSAVWNYFLRTGHSIIYFKDNENSVISNDDFAKPLKNILYANSMAFNKNKYNLDMELTYSNYDNDIFTSKNKVNNDFASLISFGYNDKINYNIKFEHIGSDFNSAGNYNYIYDNDKNKITAEFGTPLYETKNQSGPSILKQLKFRVKCDAYKDNLSHIKDYASTYVNINPELNYSFGTSEINLQYQTAKNYSDDASNTSAFIKKVNTTFYLYNLYYNSVFVFDEESNKNLNLNAGLLYSYFDNNSKYIQIQEYLDYDRFGINFSANYNNLIPELNLSFFASYNRTNYLSNKTLGDTELTSDIFDYSLSLNYSMFSNKIRPYISVSRQFNDAELQDYTQKKIKAGLNIVLTEKLNAIAEYENDTVDYSPSVSALDYSNYKYYLKLNYIFGFEK